MKRFRVTLCVASVAVGGLAALPSRSAAEENLVEKGRVLAEQHCIRCHVVRDDSPFTGIASSPSFRLLVTALPDWHERFQTFYQRRPHPAVVRFQDTTPPTGDEAPTRTVDLMLEDVEAIVAFAESMHEKYQGEGNPLAAGEGPDPLFGSEPGEGLDLGAGAGPGPAIGR